MHTSESQKTWVFWPVRSFVPDKIFLALSSNPIVKLLPEEFSDLPAFPYTPNSISLSKMGTMTFPHMFKVVLYLTDQVLLHN